MGTVCKYGVHTVHTECTRGGFTCSTPYRCRIGTNYKNDTRNFPSSTDPGSDLRISLVCISLGL